MAAKLKSERFTLASADLGAAVARLGLALPEAPLFADVPTGNTELDPKWMRGKKLRAELTAAVEALCSPDFVLRYTRLLASSSLMLESWVLATRSKAPFFLVSRNSEGDWDVLLMATKGELKQTLGKLSFGDAAPRVESDAPPGVQVTLNALYVLAAAGDLQNRYEAEALLSFRPGEAKSVYNRPLDSRALSQQVTEAVESCDLRWSVCRLMNTVGLSSDETELGTLLERGISALQTATLVDQERMLSLSAVGLMQLIRSSSELKSFVKVKEFPDKPELSMLSSLESNHGKLLLVWHLDEDPALVTVILDEQGYVGYSLLGRYLN
ncbi:MAG: hypothetical protein AAGI88_05240 [Pseudomonadota bacterium]